MTPRAALRPPHRSRLHPPPDRRLPPELAPDAAHAAALALPLGVRDPGFARLVERIDDGRLHDGTRVELYAEGGAAFNAKEAAIRAAQHEVLFETYILRDDATGRRFRDALADAARRGVAVRVLADAFGSGGIGRRFWRVLTEAGAEVRLYHRLLRRGWQQVYRDHRKIIVADRSVAFIGGMNVGDEYGSARAGRGRRFRDTHARVEGSVAGALARVFEEGWLRAHGTPLPELPEPPRTSGSPRCLVLDARPGRGYTEVAAVLAALVGAARERLWLANPYFCPPPAMIGMLGAAARRGVDVRLLLPGRSDVPVLRHAAHGFYATLLGHGVRILEYQPAILHAKTLLCDDAAIVVGSSNLDLRSFRFNAECNLLALGEAPAARMRTAFEADFAESREITAAAWARTALPHRVLDWCARALGPIL